MKEMMVMLNLSAEFAGMVQNAYFFPKVTRCRLEELFLKKQGWNI